MDQVTSGGGFEGLFDIFEGVRDLSRGNFEGIGDIFEGVRDLSHHH
jgi:hypothetical protein